MRSIIVSVLLLWMFTAAVSAQEPAAAPAPMQSHSHAMHDQHLQEMKAQVEKMRANLEQMKANVARLKDSSDKKIEQANVELWDGMISHMEGMVAMMSSGPGPEMGMDHDMHAGMACCAHAKGGHEGGCCGGMKEGAGCCAGMKDAAGCCAGMKDAGGCCGGGKCTKPDADSGMPSK